MGGSNPCLSLVVRDDGRRISVFAVRSENDQASRVVLLRM